MPGYKNCTLCQRKCGIDRTKKSGICGMTDELYVARAALHRWEEPIISGDRGSGTIFFSGCSLKCIFCQNREISRAESGIKISVRRLSEIMKELETKGAHNINLVTPTHYIPSIIDAVKIARKDGLKIPIVYNTASYETKESLKSLKGVVDVYLADLKYYSSKTAQKYSSAQDYPVVSREAIKEMVEQVGACKMGADGTLYRGVIVRVLLLPGHVAEAKLIVKHLYEEYGDNIFISIMSQYTPMPNMQPPLNRKVTHNEYFELCEYAEKLGVRNGFTQDFASAEDSFIPPFDNEGVLPEIPN